ncbi:hypothetical protein KQJ23_12400 [Paenibacillus sp. MSJ-6]|uniref:DUF3906 family protein n=2 Tax=Paenibacillus brevis TaxID=2841508 RepID=A0ABS6FTA1_9BACL|nr:hypothetical protein [Paenibacillus brevis]
MSEIKYKYFYMVEWFDKVELILAESTEEALLLFFKHQKEEREKNDMRLSFDPRELKVRQLQREDLVVKAP